MQEVISIQNALISVSNKTGITDFARSLTQLGIQLISTGKTSELLHDNQVASCTVTEITGFPEIMDGRVKTLHPKIHAGILGLRDKHADVAKQYHIAWLDLVIVNLYPFAETIKKPGVTLSEAIEKIDVGGPTMIRAAAKNFAWVVVVVDPKDYSLILDELQTYQGIRLATRRYLAVKAFTHTAAYDATISAYLQQDVIVRNAVLRSDNLAVADPSHAFPSQLTLSLEKHAELRYGENPQQRACAYRISSTTSGLLSAIQHQGKPLSYNNLVDADAAWNCVREFAQPACVIVKHANPCGAAESSDISNAFTLALHADAVSAFGGIVALNRPCTQAVAEQMAQIFMEVIIAPSYDAAALSILAAKPNLRVLAVPVYTPVTYEMKYIEGAVLVQGKDTAMLTETDLQVVTRVKPSQQQLMAMLFAWRVLKHMKSNAILIANAHVTVGVGVGQVSRVDAVELAIRKMQASSEQASELILASDAFFPFRDSIDKIAPTGIPAIIQSGGSMRDAEVIAACDEHGLVMVLTGKRCFRH